MEIGRGSTVCKATQTDCVAPLSSSSGSDFEMIASDGLSVNGSEVLGKAVLQKRSPLNPQSVGLGTVVAALFTTLGMTLLQHIWSL